MLYEVITLAFARTFYPRTPIFQYLNTLSQQAHQVVYRNKRESSRRIKTFIKTELPLELRAARPWFLLSLAVFLFAWLLGCASVLNDEGFIRLILGNDYVNMTLDNIEQGDPMAVYKSMDQLPMFVFITFNNVYVAFRVFLYGILTPLGSVWQLFLNGLMVGSFQTFFIEKNLFGVSTMAVMIHGTLELSAIIIAGGAGIMLSKNLFFPGTYSRKEAFINGASKGLKIMLGVIPVFMVAGFFEGFVTRHYVITSYSIHYTKLYDR